MKILYLVHQFYPEYYTGTEKFVLNQAMMMQKFGHKVVVLTYSFYEDSFYDSSKGPLLYKEFVYKGIPVVAVKHKVVPEDINHTLSNRDIFNAARDLIGKIEPDIVHVGHTMRLSSAVKALPCLNIPYVMTLTDFFMICPKVILMTSNGPLCRGPREGTACRNLCPELDTAYIGARIIAAQEILNDASFIASPSQFLADIFNNEFNDLNVQVVPHGMKYILFKRNEKRYLKEERIIFCYAGSLNSFKGVHLLIEAFKNIRSDYAVLRIYGSGPDQAYVGKLIADAMEDKRIEFCGIYPQEKIGDVLATTDMVIIPSLCYETYSLILHEAFACNIPVTASNTGVLGEKIEHGTNGLLFNMGDSEDLTKQLQSVMDDPSFLTSLKHGINYMASPTIEQEAYIYERIYKQITL